MHKPVRIFIILAIVALAFGLMALLGHTSSSRRALQNYKAELRAKGEKLSYAELRPFPQTNISDSLIADARRAFELVEVRSCAVILVMLA